MEEMTMRRAFQATVLFFWLSMFSGCAVMSMVNSDAKDACEDAVFAKWGEENRRQNQALGERVYQRDFDLVFTACVTGLAHIGFSVKNMERQSGYLLTEGPDPVPLEEEKARAQGMVDELNACNPYGNTWHPRTGANTYAVTVTLLRLKDQTRVKLRIANVGIDGTFDEKRFQSYPPLLTIRYNTLWRAIEKQIFLDEHLDKTS
jgi:hypothetical protein